MINIWIITYQLWKAGLLCKNRGKNSCVGVGMAQMTLIFGSHDLSQSLMKTPKCWRALLRRALFVSILAQKSSKDVKTPRDVVPCRHMTSGVMTKWLSAIYIGHTIRKVGKSHFSKWRPWPLTYDLDLPTCPRYYQRQFSCQILGP